MQAERLIAGAPGIAGTVVLLDDDCGHAELTQSRAERDSALAAADDEHVGLGLDTVPGAERPGEAGIFLVVFQLDHRGQKRPDLTILETDQAVAARDLGLERDPAFGHAVGFGRAFALGYFPIARLYVRKAGAEHLADLIAAFHGL